MRTQKGLTEQILADHAQISRERLSELENGRMEIGIKTAERIASALGVSLAHFFKM